MEILIPNVGVVNVKDKNKLKMAVDLLHSILVQSEELASLLTQTKNYHMTKKLHQECIHIAENILRCQEHLKEQVTFSYDFTATTRT